MSITTSATLDVHNEKHIYKNVADNEHNVNIAVAEKGFVKCPIHPGVWISRPEP